MKREGTDVARCTVERLMSRLGLRGAVRGKVVRTTVPDSKQSCPLDRVNRQFKADRPNQLWVSDQGPTIEPGGRHRSSCIITPQQEEVR